jgi:hypothetical protein
LYYDVPYDTYTYSFSTAAYDPTRDEIVSYGAGLITHNQTWEFDGADWRRAPPIAGDVGNVYSAAAAYDARRDRVVLFGGFDDANAPRCSTAEWDGSHWDVAAGCEVFTPGADGGIPAGNVLMAYSQLRQRVVLIDGAGQGWDWDGESWSPRGSPGDADGGELHGLVSPQGAATMQPLPDGGEQLIVTTLDIPITKGKDSCQNACTRQRALGNSTWIGVDTGGGYLWSLANTSHCTATEPGCYRSRLAVDPVTHDVVQLTQASSAEGRGGPAQLWRWDGNPQHAWQASDAVASEAYAGELFAETGGADGPRLLVVAGHTAQHEDYSGSSQGIIESTYACAAGGDGGCTRLHGPQTRLPPRPSDAMPLAFDRAGHGVLFGGLATLAGPILDDTWVWDGSEWTRWQGPEIGPPARMWSTIAYQPIENDFWLFGGGGAASPAGGGLIDFANLIPLYDGWSFDVNTGWRQRRATFDSVAEGSTCEAPHAMIWVEDGGGRDGMLVVGNQTRTFMLAPAADGGIADFALDTSTTPSAGGQFALVWDPRSSQVLMFGSGYDANYNFTNDGVDRFDFKHHKWVNGGAFEAAAQRAPVYDEAAGHVLVVDKGLLREDPGIGSGAFLEQASPAGDGLPAARFNQALAYDPVRQRSLMFGGNLLDDALVNETWELSVANERPGEVCRFRVDALTPGVQLEHAVAKVKASARHSPDGAATSWSLQVWKEGRFHTVGQCVAGCSGTTEQHYEIDDPAEMRALLADGSQLGLAVIPESFNGAGTVQLDVQTVQLEVSYELP